MKSSHIQGIKPQD